MSRFLGGELRCILMAEEPERASRKRKSGFQASALVVFANIPFGQSKPHAWTWCQGLGAVMLDGQVGRDREGWINTIKQLYSIMGDVSKITVWIGEERNSNDGDGNG